MRLTAFRAGKGDCLLLKSADGANLLIDGGIGKAFRENVAPTLARMAEEGEFIDVLCVSHIDADHIEGVLELMDALLEKRVHDYQLKQGNTTHDAPNFGRPKGRPPEVKQIWHNAFHDVIGKNAGPIENMLAASSMMLGGDKRPELLELARIQNGIAQGVYQGIQLTNRVGAGQLNIPVNRPADDRFMIATDPITKVRIGSMTASVIGPFQEDLVSLRSEWNKWLGENKDKVRELRRDAKADEAELGASELDRLIRPLLAQANKFGDFELARKLGQRSEVTVPNLASLMLIVEEDGKTVLLTGDGHWRDVLDGLDAAGRLPDGGVHVDVLKVPHHGSEHNVCLEFFQQVIADHYVICADGDYSNPDLDGLDALLDSRLGDKALRSRIDNGRRFKIWVTSSPETTAERLRPHMREVKRILRGRARSGRCQFALLGAGRPFEIAA